MINGIEGIPGSGKSYESSVIHVLAALKRGRKVITNLPLNIDAYAAIDPAYRDLIEIRTRVQPVRGTWDATRKIAFEIDPSGKETPAPDSVPLFGHVWDWYTDWKHPKEEFGPLFVVDEAHVALPSAKHGKTDRYVIQWFKLHRHFNVDVLLMTQSFRDIDNSIATLMGMLIKVRKADIVGKPGYIRRVYSGFRGGEMSQEERQYDPTLFQLYTSHTQGGAVAEFTATDVKPKIVAWRRMTRGFLAASILLIVGLVAYEVFRDKPVQLTYQQKIAAAGAAGRSQAPHAPKTSSVVQSPQSLVERPQDREKDPSAAAVTTDGTDPEPYGPFGLHLTGRMRMQDREIWTFSVSQNGTIMHAVTDHQLAKAGYRWRPMSDCAGVLEWEMKKRAITCNSPQLSMASALPKGG